jgi:hypothetical protein
MLRLVGGLHDPRGTAAAGGMREDLT